VHRIRPCSKPLKLRDLTEIRNMFAIFIIFNGGMSSYGGIGLESRLEKNNVTCDFGPDQGLELLGCSLAAQGSNGFVLFLI